MKKLVLILLSLALAACSPQLTLMSRTTGNMGTGVVENAALGNSGTLTVSFSDEIYTGTWTTVQNPGSYSFGMINVSDYSNGGGFGNFNAYSMSDSGFGTALLSSNKGRSMRCEFEYNSMSMTAVGICKINQTNEIFDLQAA
ncbi:hypothetical protein [Aestuariibius sp. HNIBRBA575]|uniref:hypothetical protein n=1 Tax=Aestuariibius sp. HNIBRBA575 TaxID=3233343 RepID=UPI0034A2AED1